VQLQGTFASFPSTTVRASAPLPQARPRRLPEAVASPAAPKTVASPVAPEAAASPAAQVEAASATTEELRLKEIFDEVDLDGSGQINKRELIKTCRKNRDVAEFLGLPTTIRQEDDSRKVMEVFFQGVDRNDDRSISWDEFRKYCMPQVRKARGETS